MKNNKGFSLLELLVVICVTSIAIALATLAFGIVDKANASKAATKLEGAFNLARNTSMAYGPDNGELHIIMDNGRFYYYIGNPTKGVKGEEEDICSKSIKVSEINTASLFEGEPTSVMVNSSYTIRFKTDGTAETPFNKEFVFSNKNKRVAVFFNSSTGKVQSSTYYQK